MPSARSPFDDPLLYDWEYRRRRDDVRFYRTLAGERGGPVLDLGCGTGRLMIPLLRDGHAVVGVDRARPMLTRAAARVARLRAGLRRRALLVRGDLRALPFTKRRFSFAVAAFHRSSTAKPTPSCCSSSEGRPPRWFRADGWRSTRSRRPAGSSEKTPRALRPDALPRSAERPRDDLHRAPRSRRWRPGDDLSL